MFFLQNGFAPLRDEFASGGIKDYTALPPVPEGLFPAMGDRHPMVGDPARDPKRSDTLIRPDPLAVLCVIPSGAELMI